jgi:Flp pilus assembly pilin Flp
MRNLPERLTRGLAAFLVDKKGALTTEYVVLVGTVGLLVVGALVSVGPLLLNSYERSRAILISPFP